VRHGESERAVAGSSFALLDGHGGPALAREGRRQAEQVCARLAEEGVESLVVTPLRRTAETAAPLVRRLGLSPAVEPGLREVHLGEWEGGLYRAKVLEGDPVARRVFDEQRWDAIPGAETNEAFFSRVRAAVERVALANAGRRVAVFAHGGTIGAVLAMASGSQPFAFVGADNASISEVVVTPGRWFVRRYNDTAHVRAEPSA